VELRVGRAQDARLSDCLLQELCKGRSDRRCHRALLSASAEEGRHAARLVSSRRPKKRFGLRLGLPGVLDTRRVARFSYLLRVLTGPPFDGRPIATLRRVRNSASARRIASLAEMPSRAFSVSSPRLSSGDR
jgi:hypothetical protein